MIIAIKIFSAVVFIWIARVAYYAILTFFCDGRSLEEAQVVKALAIVIIVLCIVDVVINIIGLIEEENHDENS